MAHGKSLELKAIPTRTVEFVHEHYPMADTKRRSLLNAPPSNRAQRRARGRANYTPGTMTPYRKDAV